MPFPLIKYRYTCHNAAADKEQGDPQHEVTVVAGLGRLRQLRRYGVGLFDLLGAILVTVILIAAAAVPMLDVALGILGRRLGGDMLEVGVVLRIKLTVGFAAGFAYRLVLAGRCAAGMIGDYLSAIVTNMVIVCILMVGDHLAAVVADVIFTRVCVVGDRPSAVVANMIFVCIFVVRNDLLAVITNMIFVCVLVVGDHFAANIADMVFVRIVVQARI